MLPLHLLIACLFFVVAQVAGNNERHLITFNKINLGNLAALEILMREGGYTHAHIILNGIRDVNGAVGHLQHWNSAFDLQRSPETFPAFTTYGGRPLPEDYAGEWYESSFLGTPREPDKTSLDEMNFTRNVIYDIHQVVPTSPEDHRFLSQKIDESGGHIGRVYVQHGRNTKVPGNPGLSADFPIFLKHNYPFADRVVAIGTKSLNPPEISVSLKQLENRLPYEHLLAASKDTFAAKTLLNVEQLIFGQNARLTFLPKRLRKVKSDDYVSFMEQVRELVREGLNGNNEHVHEKLVQWVSKAKNTLEHNKRSISDESHLDIIDTQLHRLDGIELKLTSGQPEEGEIEFADAMFTVVLFSNEYKSQPFVSSRRSIDSSSSSSGHDGGVETYTKLPRKKVLKTALQYFPKQGSMGSQASSSSSF